MKKFTQEKGCCNQAPDPKHKVTSFNVSPERGEELVVSLPDYYISINLKEGTFYIGDYEA